MMLSPQAFAGALEDDDANAEEPDAEPPVKKRGGKLGKKKPKKVRFDDT
jgi:hypothetical protein